MKTATDVVGRRGEDIAESYLRTKHFQIRERNVRFGRFEIDIVAYDPREKMIVFIEVKARSHNDLRYPIRTAVDQRKRRALQQGIYRWVLHHKYEGSARIDLICIAEGQLIEHIVNIGAVFY